MADPQTRHRLYESVSGVLAQPGPPASAEAEGLLRALATWPDFGELLAAMLDDPDWLDEISQHSYRHALGFDKLVLVPLLPLGQLRLHAWWPAEPRLVEHVHDHRFWFSSVVVAGRLRNSTFRVGDSAVTGELLRHYSEDAAHAAQRWQFSEEGLDPISPSVLSDLPRSTSYTMFAEVLHRIEAIDPLTVTLFLETRATRGASSVYVAADQRLPDATAQSRFTVDEVRRRLLRLRDSVPGLEP